jgi:hypothetical protein
MPGNPIAIFYQKTPGGPVFQGGEDVYFPHSGSGFPPPVSDWAGFLDQAGQNSMLKNKYLFHFCQVGQVFPHREPNKKAPRP